MQAATTASRFPPMARPSVRRRQIHRPRSSHHPVHRRRRHRPRHLGGFQRVFDAAVEKAYGGKRKVDWYEVLAGEKAYRKSQNWLPEDTVKATIDFRVSIKGPLTTPVGGGIRSLNVALRQLMDLYQCVRPVKYYAGVPSPVKRRKSSTSSSFARTPRTSTPASSSARARLKRKSSSISSTTKCSRAPRRRYATTPA